MVVLPLAVALVSLVVLFVCLGLLHAVQGLLAPLLYGIADLLGGVPVIGRRVERWADELTGTILHWLSQAAFEVGHTIHRLWAWLAHEAAWLGRELEGLALDAFGAIRNLIESTIPRWVGRAEHAAARLFSFLWAAARRDLSWLTRRIGAVEHRALGYVERLASLLRRDVAAVLGDAWRGLRNGFRWVAHLATVTLPRDIAALEHRIGRLEDHAFNYLGREIPHLWRELSPLRLFEEFTRWLWAQLPGGLRLFLRWLWSLAVRFEHFLVAVVEGKWPPPIHHEHGKAYMRRTAQDAEGLAAALRDVLGA